MQVRKQRTWYVWGQKWIQYQFKYYITVLFEFFYRYTLWNLTNLVFWDTIYFRNWLSKHGLWLIKNARAEYDNNRTNTISSKDNRSCRPSQLVGPARHSRSLTLLPFMTSHRATRWCMLSGPTGPLLLSSSLLLLLLPCLCMLQGPLISFLKVSDATKVYLLSYARRFCLN
jgi:hypothetical protein